VLRVRERLLILPVIGQIDSRRALQITEQLLHSIRLNRAKVAVIDLTGVAAMDSGIAEHMVRTAQACRMLRAFVVLSGVSRQIGNALGGDRSGPEPARDPGRPAERDRGSGASAQRAAGRRRSPADHPGDATLDVIAPAVLGEGVVGRQPGPPPSAESRETARTTIVPIS